MSIPETPDAAPDPPELADLILRTARRLRAANADALGGLPVNPHQAHALRAIHRLEPVRPSDVAERLRVARGSATEVVDALVNGGWAERTRDPSDGRATLLSLTLAGNDLLAEVAAARDRGAERVLGALSPADRRALQDALTPLLTPPPPP